MTHGEELDSFRLRAGLVFRKTNHGRAGSLEGLISREEREGLEMEFNQVADDLINCA